MTSIGAVNLIMKPLVQLVPILCLESKTEDTEQVATQKTYCCLCDLNSQHTLKFGRKFMDLT